MVEFIVDLMSDLLSTSLLAAIGAFFRWVISGGKRLFKDIFLEYDLEGNALFAALIVGSVVVIIKLGKWLL